MNKFLETCDPEIKKRAENLINDIKSHKERKRTLPNSATVFSDEVAFNNLDLLTKSECYREVVKKTYDY